MYEEFVPGSYQSRLIITGTDQEYTPIEIAPGGVVISQADLRPTHEEADVIIVAQAIYAAKEKSKHVVVLGDDTDVYNYILLLTCCIIISCRLNVLRTVHMKLQSTQYGRAVIDIAATVQSLFNIATS